MTCSLLADLRCARWRRVAVAQLLRELAHTYGTAGGVACGASHYSRSLARLSCCGPRCCWRCSGVLCWCDCLDDDQLSTATWARQRQDSGSLIGIAVAVVIMAALVWRFGPEQLPDSGYIGGAVAIAVETIVANAVLTSGEHVDQEPADKLGRCQRHGGVAARAFKAVIFDAEGDVVVVHADQTTVGNSHPVRVARQICQHSRWSCEGFLGVDDPVDFAQGLEEIVENGLVDEVHVIAEEMQFPGIMQLGQPFQNEPPVQAGQHTHGQEEVLAAGDPFCSIL